MDALVILVSIGVSVLTVPALLVDPLCAFHDPGIVDSISRRHVSLRLSVGRHRLHGYNLKLPRLLSVAMLHFNYHGCTTAFLPALARHAYSEYEAMVFDNDYLTQAVSQLKVPPTRAALQKMVDKRKGDASAFA